MSSLLLLWSRSLWFDFQGRMKHTEGLNELPKVTEHKAEVIGPFCVPYLGYFLPTSHPQVLPSFLSSGGLFILLLSLLFLHFTSFYLIPPSVSPLRVVSIPLLCSHFVTISQLLCQNPHHKLDPVGAHCKCLLASSAPQQAYEASL